MPWTTPTLRKVRELNRDYVTANLRTGAILPNSALRVVADAVAGLAHLVLLYIDWLARQFLPDTSETEWLDRHGRLWLGGRKSATFSAGVVKLTGTNGVVAPAGTRMGGLALGNPIEFETTEEITIGDEPTPVAIIALDPGSAGNCEAGTTLNISVAISGVDATATVVSLDGGTDVESDDDLRSRVLLRIQEPPMGGDKTDYKQWTLAVPGVTRAWPFPNEMGIGTVTVRFMMDNLRASSNAIPEPEDIGRVRNYLDTVRPVTVKDFFVEAPIPQPIDIAISGLVSDDADTRAAIEASLRKMLLLRAMPGQTIYRSWVDEAISQAVGEDHHENTFETVEMASPGHIAVLGTIEYSA